MMELPTQRPLKVSGSVYSLLMSEILKTANVSYGDWMGTAAADQHQTVGHKSAYEMVGLDPEKWWIVGFDFQGQDVNQIRRLYVYAVDKESSGIANWEAIQLHGETNGSVPVTSFLVHDVTPAELIAEVFNQFQVQLRSRSLGHDIEVVDRADLNYEED
jgi:hypothetical protein